MAKVSPRGQFKNPLQMQAYQGLVLQGVAKEVVPLGSSMGWEDFADANWICVMTQYGAKNAGIAELAVNGVQINLCATTCIQVATTNAITVNVIGIGRV